MAQDIKTRARERLELRIYAQETLKTIIDWIRATKPSEWVPPGSKGGDEFLTPDEMKAKWRDWATKSADLIEKAWTPAELLVDDLTAFMEEMCAKPKRTPESK